jgi:pyrrolidone-carboxylate peptidase
MRNPHLLVTGFTPFDGRAINSSWVAATAIENSYPSITLDVLELPVVWGAPLPLLKARCEQNSPGIIVSLGEGKPGWFEIETVARNYRKTRKDNNSDLAPTSKINVDGPDCHFPHAPCEEFRHKLAEQFPVKLSDDAGSFLCEETLYTLGELKLDARDLQMTLFVHLPPYGTVLSDGETLCDDELLSEFAHHLIDTTLAIFRDRS